MLGLQSLVLADWPKTLLSVIEFPTNAFIIVDIEIDIVDNIFILMQVFPNLFPPRMTIKET